MGATLSLESIQARYTERRKALDEAKMRRSWLLEQRQDKAQEVLAALEQDGLLAKVVLLLKESSNFARETGRQLLEGMGSNIIKHILGTQYRLKIEVTERKNKPTEAEILILKKKGGVEVASRPQDANGGGVVDLVSSGLRIAMLETLKPQMSGRVVIADEPAKYVSEEFVPAFASFVASASSHFKRQWLIVTHNPFIAESAETVYRVAIDAEGISTATRER